MNRKKLIALIRQYNAAYRKGAPIVSDKEYDQLVEQLKAIDPDNEWFSHIEPAPVQADRKRKLPIPMKSLNKVKTISDLKKWAQSLGLSDCMPVVITPKFDGVSLLVDERNGNAYSRGGSENEGQDCSAHYAALNATHLTNTGITYSYGELVISRPDWEQHFDGRVSELSGDKFKSPRNTAGGLLNRDQPSEWLKYTTFFRYGADDQSLHSHYSRYQEFFADLCTNSDQELLCAVVTMHEITEELMMKLFSEWNTKYPCDGLVIYVDDLKVWEQAGRHASTGNPLYAIAYKHPDFTESFVTTVKGIIWKANKVGALKPVVNIEEVDTGDCTMENPTGYNAGWLSDREIAKGAKILVTRSGGVIPKILSVIKPASEEEQQEMWDTMSQCPHCGAPTAWNNSQIELHCTNPYCPGKELAQIIFFFTTCGYDNVGEETFNKLFQAGYNSITKILQLTFDQIVAIDGFGETTANIILANNRKLMQGIDLALLMQASNCFPGIGTVKAQKILDEMPPATLQEFLDKKFIPICNYTVLMDMPKTMQIFHNGVNHFYTFLNRTGITPIYRRTNTNADGICNGMSVCMSGFRDKQLEERIIQNGGRVVSGVSKNTTHLVVKDVNATSSKINKARELGIQVISSAEFCKIFNS